jgi:outer membrane protein assembly factor BamE (lipoprotein component of BamABCDE complex)
VKHTKLLVSVITTSLLMIGVGGCVGTEGGERQITDPGKISQIEKGVSTKASIRAAFGAPEGTSFEANGNEIWTYSYVNTSVTPATYVPIVGVFAGGTNVQSSGLTVTFDANGIVKAYAITNGGATSGQGKM